MTASNAATMPAAPVPADASAAPPMTFQPRIVSLITLAHFFHDMYPAFLAPLIPLLTQQSADCTRSEQLALVKRMPAIIPLIDLTTGLMIANRRKTFDVKCHLVATRQL